LTIWEQRQSKRAAACGQTAPPLQSISDRVAVGSE